MANQMLCRSSRGERGLKLVGDLGVGVPGESLLARGAWIETSSVLISHGNDGVAPREGSVD